MNEIQVNSSRVYCIQSKIPYKIQASLNTYQGVYNMLFHLLCVYLKRVDFNKIISFHLDFFVFWLFQSNACIVWRRFANLWETCQSLFWACFGLVSLTDFELTGIKEFTRFWALLMFGSYSVCNIIVLLNMLIAMMSNSFQVSLKFWDPNCLLH